MFAKLCFALAITTALIAAETHQVLAQKYYRTFAHGNPVLERIRPGDIVVTKTLDSGGQDYEGQHKGEAGNPLTGPFYIDGAEPGDALVVTLRKVGLNRNWGYSSYRLGLVSLLPEYVESIYSDKYKADLVRKDRSNIVPWDIDLEHGTVRLREPQSSRAKLEFPVHPMLGCIGVAAAGDFVPTSGPAGPYGGNLDYNEIVEGAIITFPVYHPGGLLYVGDGHAIMGDGEPTGTGVETSMDVEFSVDIKKKSDVTGPRVETPEYLISVGAQPEYSSSLDRGLQLATTDMVRWLVNDYGLEPWAAHLLIGAVGKYNVATVAGTMALKTPKRYLPASK